MVNMNYTPEFLAAIAAHFIDKELDRGTPEEATTRSLELAEALINRAILYNGNQKKCGCGAVIPARNASCESCRINDLVRQVDQLNSDLESQRHESAKLSARLELTKTMLRESRRAAQRKTPKPKRKH